MNTNELVITNYDAQSQIFTVEIPLNYLTDPLMMNLIYDPILSPSGSTFHRESYLQSLDANNQDPLTREMVSPAQLVKNPIMREINFSLVNQFPDFENDARSEANDYIKEKTGHGILWFKHRHLFFRGRQGLYRLLKFADTFNATAQDLDTERRNFVRQHKGMRQQYNITHWDSDNSRCRVEIPLSALMCAEMNKVMVDPITCDNDNNYHKKRIPTFVQKENKCAPNNFLKALCSKFFLSMPHLDIYNPHEIFAYAVEHNDPLLLNAAVTQFSHKINDTVSYEAPKLQTALMFSIQKQKTESTRILLACPSLNIRVTDPGGRTALDYAKAAGDTETIQKLIFPLLIEGLLKNALQYKGKGQKISEQIKIAWIDHQNVLLNAFKSTVNELFASEKFTQVSALLVSAGTTTNYFHQLVNAFPTPIKLSFSLRPLKISRKTEAGEALKTFIREKERQLELSLHNNFGQAF